MGWKRDRSYSSFAVDGCRAFGRESFRKFDLKFALVQMGIIKQGGLWYESPCSLHKVQQSVGPVIQWTVIYCPAPSFLKLCGMAC